MTDKPAPTNPKLLSLLGQAAVKAGTDNDDSRMKAAGERALRLSEKARKFARKATKEGKAGTVTDGKGTFAIVER